VTRGSDQRKQRSALEELEARIAGYERNLAKAEKANMAGLATVLEDELRDARRQSTLARKRASEGGTVPLRVVTEPSQIVREAYLRTLSRLPDEREAEIAGKYFNESGDSSKGLRDLLWALLNTKEFITNH
jgi:hypothetical protein